MYLHRGSVTSITYTYMPTKLLLWHRQVYNIPENEVNEKLCTAAGVVRTTAQARGQFENATTIVNESVGRASGHHTRSTASLHTAPLNKHLWCLPIGCVPVCAGVMRFARILTASGAYTERASLVIRHKFHTLRRVNCHQPQYLSMPIRQHG